MMSDVYAFRLSSGSIMRLALSPCEFEKRVKNGKIQLDGHFSPGEMAELISQPPKRTTSVGATWPYQSDNCAVHTSQIPAAMSEDVRIGVPTDYNAKTGAPIFTSALHRKRWAEAHGYYVVTPQGSSSSMDPVRLDDREREARAMAGRAVRKCDDQ